MEISSESTSLKRRPVNLTIREDVLLAAKNLKLNASQAAEAGILHAIRKAQENEWLESNKDALQAHNDRVEKEGVLLRPLWVTE